MKITKLTKDQAARIPEWVAKWVEIGLSIAPADFDAATKAALRGYELANLKKPMVVLRMSSPYAATVGGAYAWLLLKEFFGEQVEQQVEQQVWQQVWQQVEQQVWQQAFQAAKDGYSNYGINSLWSSWGAYVSFFRDVCGWKDEILERFEIDETLMKSCDWTWWHQNVLAISDRPKTLNRDEQGRLHCESAPSISYRDGWSLYHWHGVSVPEYVVERPQEIIIEKIHAEKNAEVQRVMIERYGEDRYIIDSGMKPVASDERFGDIYIKTVEAGRPIAKIRVTNRSPEPDGSFRNYWLNINPAHYNGDAGRIPQAAVASTWRTKEGGKELFFKKWQDYSPVLET